MPRPGESRTTTEQKTSKNPFVDFLNRQKQKREKLEAQAAMQITADTAENEAKIIKMLKDISFLEENSKLPPEILNAKREETGPYGELEYCVKSMIETLEQNTAPVQVNLCSIDEKIYLLAKMLSEAVEHGYARAAYMAKDGLLCALNTVRPNVPKVQGNTVKQYIDQNSVYLERWILLVQQAKEEDGLQDNVDRQKESYHKKHAAGEQNKDDLMERIKQDDALMIAYDKLRENLNAEELKHLPEGDPRKQLRLEAIKLLMEDAQLELKALELTAAEEKLLRKRQFVELIEDKLQNGVVVTDPDSMSRLQDLVDEIFEDLDKNDQEMDEMLTTMEKINARIEDMENKPGRQHMNALSAKELKKLEERQNEQYKQEEKERAKKLREKYGFTQREQKEQEQQRLQNDF